MKENFRSSPWGVFMCSVLCIIIRENSVSFLSNFKYSILYIYIYIYMNSIVPTTINYGVLPNRHWYEIKNNIRGATSNGVTSVRNLTDIRNFLRKLFSETNKEEHIHLSHLFTYENKIKHYIIITTIMSIIKWDMFRVDIFLKLMPNYSIVYNFT
jgi:hypothetical protein